MPLRVSLSWICPDKTPFLGLDIRKNTRLSLDFPDNETVLYDATMYVWLK